MKILCPVDFSEEGINATLTLVNVQKLSIGEGMTMFAGGERESHKLASEASDLLADYCNDIRLTFNVEADYIVMTSMNTVENCINDVGHEYKSFHLFIWEHIALEFLRMQKHLY